MPEHAYIAIEGPIGVGKTTLARMLQPEFGAELLLEIFEENPFLSDFYADRERFAFQTQIVFLLSRYRQQREVERIASGQSLISDYIFAKDRLFALLNLRGDELETYQRLHSALAERVVVPDLVLYLRASPEALMERIATRDRPYERSMPKPYIVDLARAYEQFFATYQDARVLVIDTDPLDVVRNPADLQSVARRIREALADGRRGRAPAARPVAGPGERLQALEGALAGGQGEDARAAVGPYLELLGLQRAIGELAGAMLRAWTPGPAARATTGPALAELERELPALREALAVCQASLQRLGRQLG